MPQAVMEAGLFVGTLEAPEITPLGSLDADRGTTAVTPEGENPGPFLAIIYNGIRFTFRCPKSAVGALLGDAPATVPGIPALSPHTVGTAYESKGFGRRKAWRATVTCTAAP